VSKGQVPEWAAIEEAFEAIEKIRTELPYRGKDEQELLNNPPGSFADVVPPWIYLPFAVGLGKRDSVREVFQNWERPMLNTPWDMRHYSALYEVCLGEGYHVPLISESEAEMTVERIVAALAERKEQGQLEPLKGLEWPELLRRFSEAAFKAYAKAYGDLDDPPQKPEDILLPPITHELLAEVEQRLGLLPLDLRKMMQSANGWRGTYDMAGGFPGIDKMVLVPCKDEWMKVSGDGLLQVHRDGLPEEIGEAPMWRVCGGTDECEDGEHLICPPETWRKLVGDDRPTAEEYRVTYKVHWDGDVDANNSMKDLIESEKLYMERLLEIRDKGLEDEEEDP